MRDRSKLGLALKGEKECETYCLLRRGARVSEGCGTERAEDPDDELERLTFSSHY